VSAVSASPAASGSGRGVPADPVRALQHALYRAAKADPGRRFHALYDKISRSDVLWRAWAEVRRNNGAPGTDKITLAQVEEYLAIGRMRTAGKLADLSMALAGRFTGHHVLLCRLHLDRIAVLDDGVDGLDKQIAGKAGRWQREQGLLTSVPGFGDVVAQAWLGEIGPAPHRHFATCEKLASWVTLCSGNNISARKRKHGRTGDAGTYIKPMLVQAAWNAIRVRGSMRCCPTRRSGNGPSRAASASRSSIRCCGGARRAGRQHGRSA